VPVHLCWDWFPNNKGLATGICLGGFGFGAFIFGFISRWLVNPKGLPLNKTTNRFELEVTERVPFMLRSLVAIWICFVIIGLLLIRPPNHGKHHIPGNCESEDEANMTDEDKEKKRQLEERLLKEHNDREDAREKLRRIITI
jgi:hypothetical protein